MPLDDIVLRLGVAKDEADYGLMGYASDSQWIRFVNDRVESQGGWQKKNDLQMTGICRGLFEWTANDGSIFNAIGTHCKLYVNSAGYIQNITPEASSGTLGADPFTTEVGTPTISVAHTNHGRKTGDSTYFRGATAVGGITPGGPSGTFSSNPFTTTSGSNVVQVTDIGHTMASNDEVTIAGGSTFNGVTISGTYLIRVINDNVYQIYHSVAASASGSGGGTPTYEYGRAYIISNVTTNAYDVTHYENATSTATGGGSAVDYLYELSCGLVDGVSNTGWSTGPYSAGPYSVSIAGATILNNPRTWSFAQYGEILIANPYYGKIYEWNKNWSQRATQVTNSPDNVIYTVVTAQRQIMAIGCTNPSGAFDPLMLRWCDIEDRTVWTGAEDNNAGLTKLGSGSQAVCGSAGDTGTLVWTDNTFYFVSFVGDFGQTYKADEIGPTYGILGPKAFVDLGDEVYWVTRRGTFVKYRGGSPEELQCRSKSWFTRNFAPGQGWKCYAFYDQRYNAVSWLFPFDPSLECSNYIRFDIDQETPDGAGGWSVGTLDRTAWLDVSVLTYPIAVSSDGYLYEHENGNSADGAVITRSIDFRQVAEVANGSRVLNLNQVIPNANVISGSVGMFFDFRRFPNGPVTTKPTSGTPFAITNSVQYINPRGQGRSLGVRLISTGANDNWSVGSVQKARISGSAQR